MTIEWRFARFADLSPGEIHDLYRLRVGVFVVEQNCVFQDLDGLDPQCWHLLGHSNGDLVAYARFLPPGLKYDEPSIGRVTTAQSARRTGLGRALMREALERAGRLWPGLAVRIGAQARLQRFYEDFGFAKASAPYDEDGIPHIEMVRAAPAAKTRRGRVRQTEE